MKRATALPLAVVLALAVPFPALAARIRIPIIDGELWETILGLAVIAVVLYIVQRLFSTVWEKICGLFTREKEGESKYFRDE